MPATPAYDFTQDWFSKHVPVWNKLLPSFAPRKYLEIGSYEGRSACYIIDRFSADASLDIHCIDTWEGGVEHGKVAMGDVERRFDANIALARQSAKHPAHVTKHKKRSHVALAELMTTGHALSFDVVYIDGSHQAPDVLADAVLSFPLLRVDGLMIFDDYLWSEDRAGKQDAFGMPKPAIDAFLNIYQRKMLIAENAPLSQLYVKKNAA
ncbi:MAG: class I SAM-dependent methyltransferase [Rhodospirillaceae bacterium]|nr:class I SAM-dependent methyltransferase [Rhodospirillaceae bacterium]